MEGLQGEDLEEQDAERVHVGAGVELVDLAAELLGGHVAGRAHHLADLGLLLGAGGLDAGGRILGAGELGEAPVEQVHLAEVAEHDVARLEIAVQHPARIGEGHRQADAAQGGEEPALGVGRGQGGVALLQPVEDLGEGLAVEPLHGEEGRAVRPHPEVVDGDDGGVLELPLHARLALEAHVRVGVGDLLLAEHLHGHVAADADVLAEADHAHAPLAQHALREVARPEPLLVERRPGDAHRLAEALLGGGRRGGGGRGRLADRGSADGLSRDGQLGDALPGDAGDEDLGLGGGVLVVDLVRDPGHGVLDAGGGVDRLALLPAVVVAGGHPPKVPRQRSME